MNPPNNYKKNILKYWPLLIIGFIIMAIGFFLLKVIPLSIAGVSYYFFDNKFHWGNWVWILSLLLFWASFGISFPIGKRVIELGDKIMKYGKEFNSYIAMYGSDFKKPKLEDFGLIPEEYYAFNRRKNLNGLKDLLPLGVVCVVIFLSSKFFKERGFILAVIMLSIALSLALLVRCLIIWLDDKLARRWPQYNKIKAYNKSLIIYKAIEDELREIRLNADD